MEDKETEKFIGERLEFYGNINVQEEIQEVIDLSDLTFKFNSGFRCEGVLSALTLKLLNEDEYEIFWDIVIDPKKPLSEAYEMLLKIIEADHH